MGTESLSLSERLRAMYLILKLARLDRVESRRPKRSTFRVVRVTAEAAAGLAGTKSRA